MKYIILFTYITIVLFIVFVAGNDYRFRHLFIDLGPTNFTPFKAKYRFLQHPEEWGGNNMFFFVKEATGNLFLLFPLPIILILFHGVSNLKKVIFLSFLLSIFIEVIQFISGMGNADIDDVLLNTFGATLGTYLSFWIKKQNCWINVRSYIKRSGN